MGNINKGGYIGDERRSKRLHLDPTVSWGHILTTIAMVGAGLAAWVNMGERLTQVESDAAHNKELIQILDRQTKEDRQQLKDGIEDVSEKLDRLIQGLLNGHTKR